MKTKKKLIFDFKLCKTHYNDNIGYVIIRLMLTNWPRLFQKTINKVVIKIIIKRKKNRQNQPVNKFRYIRTSGPELFGRLCEELQTVKAVSLPP